MIKEKRGNLVVYSAVLENLVMRSPTRRQFLGISAGAALATRAVRAQPGKRPNVLWIITDEQRTDSLGCYGSPWARTPALDALAREGVVFETAITPAPVCAPARASLMTGRYPHETGIWHNIPPGQYLRLDHLTALFHRAGYRSGSIGKRHYSATNPGFEYESHFEVSEEVDWFHYRKGFKGEDFGVIQYPPEPYAWILGGRFPAAAEHKPEARVVREALAWLDSQGDDPFLLRVSFNAPHTPVVPPRPFDSLIPGESIQFASEVERAPENEPGWLHETLRSFSDAKRLSPEQLQGARQYYYGEAAYLDSQIAALLQGMRERGRLDNTLIAFVSDHGVHLGDYGLVQKQTFYPPVVNVPYFFCWPGNIAGGRRIETPVETRSLLPTLLALCDLEPPEASGPVSLAECLMRGTSPEPAPVFSEFTLGTFQVREQDRLAMMRHEDWVLTLAFLPEAADGGLYNLAADPHQVHNLYGATEHGARQSGLQALLEAHLHPDTTS